VIRSLRTVIDLHTFLEHTLPESVGADLGVGSPALLDMLGDSLDELDGVIIAALDEIERLEGLSAAALEEALSPMWRRTFTRYASAAEGWMEAAFIKRGQAVVERLNPTRTSGGRFTKSASHRLSDGNFSRYRPRSTQRSSPPQNMVGDRLRRDSLFSGRSGSWCEPVGDSDSRRGALLKPP